jgi:hypothetical protein
MVTKGADGRFYKPCPSCNKMQSYLRKNYAEESLRLGKECKGCSNKHTDNCGRGFYKDIRVSWFNKFKIGAKLRSINFELSIEDLWELFEKQNKVCALTGWPIGWATVGANHTASIDRIDSKQGYIKGNVQIVHKDINMMKQSYTQEYFIQACLAISSKVGT